MIETTQQLWIFGLHFLQNIVNFSKPFLQNLDPSLFQNVILGVLAIFIPFAIVFLTDILNSKKKKKGEFEKMVLNDEVLETKKIFWLAIASIFFFAFFSGKDVFLSAKIGTIFAVFILIFLFWTPFKKILRFSEGHKPEFKILFLKKLNFSKIFKFKNKTKAEKMTRAWNSFWLERSEFNERDFTKVFISHIDDAIKYRELNLAIQLSQAYINNIKKRDRFSISYEILPKVFEWNGILWNEQQMWLKRHSTEKEMQNFISQKYFPILGNWVLKLYKKIHKKRSCFWNWHYFEKEFFQATIKELLKDRYGTYQLFSLFKKHIEESEKKLDKIKDEKKKEKYWHYITGLFASFCPTFFDAIDSVSSSYSIWEHNFPKEWKITVANKESRIPRVILHDFLQWSRNRIFRKENKENFDKGLTEVISRIFPNIHSMLFTAFLMLLFSDEVKNGVKKEPNFYIFGASISGSGSVEGDEEDRNKRLADMMKAKEISQKEETIQIILNFFHFWQILKIYKHDLTEKEFSNWRNTGEKQRQLMAKRVRSKKLKKMKTEIESDEIKETCKNSERKEMHRKDFLELVQLLLAEITKN